MPESSLPNVARRVPTHSSPNIEVTAHEATTSASRTRSEELAINPPTVTTVPQATSGPIDAPANASQADQPSKSTMVEKVSDLPSIQPSSEIPSGQVPTEAFPDETLQDRSASQPGSATIEVDASSTPEIETELPTATSTPPPPPYSPQTQSRSSISPDRVRYILALNESSEPYEQFFDALSIKRNKHDAFFRDLRAFRSQPHIIEVLATPITSDSMNSNNSTDGITALPSARSSLTAATTQSRQPVPIPSESKISPGAHQNIQLDEIYRKTTTLFLASSFSKPWFSNPLSRNPNPNPNSSPKPQSTLFRRLSLIGSPKPSPPSPVLSSNTTINTSESHLHTLLLPVWTAFRTRMTPSPILLSRFLEWEARRIAEEESKAREIQIPSDLGRKSGRKPRPTTIYATRQDRKVTEGRGTDVLFDFDASDDERTDYGDGLGIRGTGEQEGDGAANTAAKMFVGAAAAGYLLENKRVRKYLLEKLG